ncbi:hypothetical protein CCACVL1_08397 [Corchorus capsularis]|uniref:Uncharacterized protein n=1 Tax=Corchorus capsularis TaxID=210143 RepID=A0A1R3J0R2_COCAP|nr:hypothetical protein CCACVL1_08397 [Corchorus capsularis]
MASTFGSLFVLVLQKLSFGKLSGIGLEFV